MIIDTSALIAILRDEPEAKDCARAIERNPIRRLDLKTVHPVHRRERRRSPLTVAKF